MNAMLLSYTIITRALGPMYRSVLIINNRAFNDMPSNHLIDINSHVEV